MMEALERDLNVNLSYDDTERKIVVHSYQDVEPIIERNKKLQSIEQKSDWGRHVATIPNNILYQWMLDEWQRGNTSLKMFDEEFDKLVERKLRDPDWRWLRTDR